MYWLQVMAAERRVPMSVTMARSQSEGETKMGRWFIRVGGLVRSWAGSVALFSQSQAAIANGRG